MFKNYYKDMIVIFLTFCIFLILSLYLSISFSTVLVLEIPILIGTILLSIVSNFAFFGKKMKAEIIDYTLGFGGSSNLSNGGRGRKYTLQIEKNLYNINYASLSSYNRGTIVTVFFSKNKKIILLRDILILSGASFFFLQFPIRYILGLV